jgi:hypothetical protein
VRISADSLSDPERGVRRTGERRPDGRPDRQEKAMLMNHDLTTRLARDHQRQMIAEASHQQRHQPRRPAPQAPRTAIRITRGLAAAIISARAW